MATTITHKPTRRVSEAQRRIGIAVSAKVAEWWRNGAREIYRGESDGQQFASVFMRRFAGKTEYAIVVCSDGDYLDHVFGGFVIRDTKVTLIEPDLRESV